MSMAEEQINAEGQGRKRVLVIDDNRDLVAMFVQLLQREAVGVLATDFVT